MGRRGAWGPVLGVAVLAAWTSRAQDRVGRSVRLRRPGPSMPQPGPGARDTRLLLWGSSPSPGRPRPGLCPFPRGSSPCPVQRAHRASRPLASFLPGEPGRGAVRAASARRGTRGGGTARARPVRRAPGAGLELLTLPELKSHRLQGRARGPTASDGFPPVPTLCGFALCSYLRLEALVLEKGKPSSSKRPAAACATLASEHRRRDSAARGLAPASTARRTGTHAWTLSWDPGRTWEEGCRSVCRVLPRRGWQSDGKPRCGATCLPSVQGLVQDAMVLQPCACLCSGSPGPGRA